MRAPVSWVREFVPLPEDVTGRDIGDALIRAGLEVEGVEPATEISGPLTVGRVLSIVDEPQKNGKVIRWCRVDVGAYNENASEPAEDGGSRGIVCGAHNFVVGDLVVVALPGTILPGGFLLTARKTYGHISDGMICAVDELGIGTDHTGILVLDPGAGAPGDDAIALLGLDDEVLDIAVTADMGYCLSVRGLARETAQAFDLPFTDPVALATPAARADGFPVRSDTDACPLFVAVSVTGVDPSRPSPDWMQSRLRMSGMRSVSLAVDITNYVMIETGQPLHAYDADRLAGGIVVRDATPGERLTTLDDVDRALSPEDLVITDDSGVIGLAGVMGGATTELPGRRPTSSSRLRRSRPYASRAPRVGTSCRPRPRAGSSAGSTPAPRTRPHIASPTCSSNSPVGPSAPRRPCTDPYRPCLYRRFPPRCPPPCSAPRSREPRSWRSSAARAWS